MELDFQSFLQSIGFSLDLETIIPDSASSSQSFGKVFSHLFGCTSEFIFQSMKSPNFLSDKETFLQKEFSHQKSWIKDSVYNEHSGFLPLLFSCSSICNTFHHDIILVCDSLNLSFIHKSHRLLKIFSEKSNGNFVVVGLDENNIFKVLIYHGTREFITQLIENIPDYAIISLDDVSSESALDTFRESRAFGRTNNYTEDLVDENIENVTIRQYLNNHFLDSSQGYKVADSSFNNNDKIDIHSSDFRYEHEYLVSFYRTLDLDAFFGLFKDCEFQNCLVGGGQIVSFKDFSTNKREISSLKKVFQDSGIGHFTKFKCIKFAELESSHSYEVFAIAAGSSLSQGFDNFDLKSCLESAHFHANRFPCILNNCIHSKEHSSIRNGRPDYHTQIKSYSFKWDYESKSFKCLIKVMLDFLRTAVSSYEGLDVYYYVKSIGSKFKTVFTSLNHLNSMIKNFLSPFDLNKLLAGF